HAFEPINEHRECFEKNVPMPRSLHAVALGVTSGWVNMETAPGSSGSTHVVSGRGETEMRTLDSFELNFVDFIKIDCEGYEPQVLQGAKATLERCRPCVIVEQK